MENNTQQTEFCHIKAFSHNVPKTNASVRTRFAVSCTSVFTVSYEYGKKLKRRNIQTQNAKKSCRVEKLHFHCIHLEHYFIQVQTSSLNSSAQTVEVWNFMSGSIWCSIYFISNLAGSCHHQFKQSSRDS